MAMRLALLPLAVLVWFAPQAAAPEPFVGVGVWYGGPGARPPSTVTADVAALRSELALIRRAGFNMIVTWINWRDAEPKRAGYVLAGTERLIAAATEADLKVRTIVFADPPPDWARGVADAAGQFTDYVRNRLTLQKGVIDVARHTPAVDASPGRITVTAETAPEARLALWSAISRGERNAAFFDSSDPVGRTVLSLGETAGVITRNQALFAPLRPRAAGVTGITASGGGAPVDVRLLESADALMIIALNHARAPQTTTITFSMDIPEAIWQNLETGTAVNFVMGRSGPFLEHTFAPRDALVLMIRKRLR